MTAKHSADTDPPRDRAAGAAKGEPVAPAILILANLLKRSSNIAYHTELGLSSIAWRILARLGDQGPMTHTELAVFAQVDKGQLSRAAAQLADDGLILRHRRTWRSIELRLAPKGRAVFAALKRISRARHKVLTAGISPQDLQLFAETLDKITDNARRLLQQQEAAGDETA